MTNHKLKVVSKDSDLTDMSDVWDTKNRLLAASYNGYVSSYIYDADGNRMVKLSAPYEAVYTNSTDATVPSDTLRYTLYVGPHYTVTGTTGSEDVEPRYVKHFFIGNKRVASKIANAPGYDPRGITTVAGKSIYVKVDYPVKYGEQKAQVSGNYTNFAMPYSNIDMNNYDYPFNRPGYWNGCVPPNNTGTVVVMGNRDSESEETDSIGEPEQRTSPVENLSFFYHTDHLGSTNLVTGSGPTLCHATEYLPYGEEFVDLMASGSDPELPFKFNGKELDSETGLLYYGARYYMPKYYQWPTCDPMELKYPGVSSYSFCHNNPLNRIDDIGLDDYEMNSDGSIYLSRRTKDHYDNLIHGNSRIRINDKKLLPQFTQNRNEYDGNYAITSNEADAGKLFIFAAKNSEVEWGLNGYKTRNGKRFLIRTSHNSSSVGVTNGPYNLLDMFVNVHSHAGKSGRNYASGYDVDPNKNSDNIYYTDYSDFVYMNDTFNAFKAADKSYPDKYPKLYIYLVRNNEKIEYNDSRKRIPRGKVNGYQNIIK